MPSLYPWNLPDPYWVSLELWDIYSGEVGDRQRRCPPGPVWGGGEEQREQPAGQDSTGVFSEGQPHLTSAQVKELGTER